MRCELRALLAAAGVVAVTITGCASVPDSGPVQIGKGLPQLDRLDEPDVQVVPNPPQPGEQPQSIVIGFLQASADADNGYAVAREFLTPEAARSWQPDTGVTIYDPEQESVTADGLASVGFSAPMVGRIGPDGAFRVADGTYNLELPMVRVAGQWRIARAPQGLLLGKPDVDRSYKAVDVYFLDRDRNRLVPDRVYLQTPRRGLATALVRQLVAGPSQWLRPAVGTAIPAGTRLLGNVPVERGVAEVQLSDDVLAASPSARRALAAQLVWTLRQLSDVAQIEITVSGSALTIPGAPNRMNRTAWASYAPDGVDTTTPYVYRVGARVFTDSGRPVAGRLGAGAVALHALALANDAHTVAGLGTVAGGRTALFVGGPGVAPRERLRAGALTPPSWDLSGQLWTVATDGATQRLVTVSGQGEPVTVPAADLFKLGRVTEFAIAPDATRAAALVTNAGGQRLVLARVVVRGNGLAVEAPYLALPAGYTRLGSLSWAASDQLALLADPPGSAADTPRVPLQVSIDGSTVTQVPTGDLPAGDLTALATAPGQPLLVSTAQGLLYSNASGSWAPLGRGADPSYAG